MYYVAGFYCSHNATAFDVRCLLTYITKIHTKVFTIIGFFDITKQIQFYRKRVLEERQLMQLLINTYVRAGLICCRIAEQLTAASTTTGIERARNICLCFGRYGSRGLLSNLMLSYCIQVFIPPAVSILFLSVFLPWTAASNKISS